MSSIVALLSVEMHFPEAHSLKEKRMLLRRVKDRLKKFNIATAEVEHLDKWQRTQIGIVTVSNTRIAVDQALNSAIDEIERVQPGLITRTQVDFLT